MPCTSTPTSSGGESARKMAPVSSTTSRRPASPISGSSGSTWPPGARYKASPEAAAPFHDTCSDGIGGNDEIEYRRLARPFESRRLTASLPKQLGCQPTDPFFCDNLDMNASFARPFCDEHGGNYERKGQRNPALLRIRAVY